METVFNSILSKNFLQLARRNAFNRMFHISSRNMIKVGDTFPSVELYEGNPVNAINIADFCKDKKVVLFGVPGAFTPGCSKTHLPGFVEKYVYFKKKGADEIICVAVNDVFVMDAWGRDHDAIGKIRMFADPKAEFTKLIGLAIDIPKLGGIRSKRYSLIADKGIITFVSVEPDGTGLSCSLASKIPL